MSLYILTNPILKNKYDIQFNKIYNHDIVAGNQNEDCNLDSLFNIDNEWMKTTEHTIETKSDLRKNKISSLLKFLKLLKLIKISNFFIYML